MTPDGLQTERLKLQATQQLGLLAGVFLLAQNATALQGRELFDAGKNIAVAA